MEPNRGELARRAAAIVLWLALFWGLVPLGNWLVPDATKAKIPFQTFLMACQIATLVLGCAFAVLLVRPRRKALGVDRLPGPFKLVSTVASVPIVFVASSYIALQIALPTLLMELKTRGPGASAQNAGAFGKALAQTPALTALLWGALFAALGEELFFRGLLWTTITEVTKRFQKKPPALETTSLSKEAAPAPSSKEGASGDGPVSTDAVYRPSSTEGGPEAPATSVAGRIIGVLLRGGIATILCAALFGYMHKDLPGGVGIVRFWSTTLLGLASGIVRQVTSGVLACILLHALYNTIAIGIAQKWFRAKEVPVLDGVPNTLVLMAVLGAVLLGVVAFVRALQAKRARAFLPID